MTAAIVSGLHVLALGLGLASVWWRGRALRGTLDAPGLARLFAADNAWAIAALLLAATGLARAFAGLEKGTAFYLGSSLFWTKLALFAAVGLLEVWPMTTLLRWRSARRRGEAIDARRARTLYVVIHVEMTLVVAIVFAAAFMARGF